MNINKNFVLTLFLTFFNSGGIMILILTSLFFNDMHFDARVIGVLSATFGIGAFLGAYTGGHLSDFISAKNIMSFSILGNSVFILSFALTENVVLFGICMFLIGFCNAGFRPSSMLMLINERGKLTSPQVLAYRKVVFNLGFSIFSAIFGFLYSSFQKNAFFLIATLFFINFLLSLLMKNNKELLSVKKEESVRRPNFWVFASLIVLVVINMMILTQYQMAYPLFLENISGLSVAQISTIFTIHGLIILIFQIPMGYLFDKINISIGCAIGSLLLAFGMGLTYISSNFYIILALCIVWTFAEMILFQLLLPFILDVSIYKKGKTMGLYNAAFSLGGFLAPLLAGVLYVQNPVLLWNICFLIGIGCAIVFFIIYMHYKKSEYSF